MSIQPIENRLILKPSDSVMRGTIFIPSNMTGMATSCLVMAVGPTASPFIKVGETVLCEIGFGDRENNTIRGTNMFWCRDNNVYAIIRKREIFPIGNKILIKRDVAEASYGSIVIPENRRTQSLDGIVVKKGLTRIPYKINGINIGDKVRLKSWEAHMIEVELEDKSYGLIVLESDLLYKYPTSNEHQNNRNMER